ncbi:MAG: septum formation initiator family protein [Alphaproteobacteria bacterium]|nr:septum formation initiator family protein [Alphaproteobacteria bacterium]MBF0251406.1 septum formation initiator family protein [Alphaproteobacteria bacterium]
MNILREVKGRGGQILGPVIGVCMVVYFAFHAVQGDRGVIALGNLQGRIDDLQGQVLDMRAQRMDMERKVLMLRPQSLDPDLLEERARTLLGYGRPDELVVILGRDVEDVATAVASR